MRDWMSVVILAALLSGCGPSVQERRPHPVNVQITHLENQRRSTAVGEVMTSSSPLFVRETMVLGSRIEADTTHRGRALHVVAEVGTYALVAKDSDGQFYESLGTPVAVNDQKAVGGLYVPADSSEPAALYWHWVQSLSNSEDGVAYMAPLAVSPEVRTSTLTLPSAGSGLVSTLTYAGVAGGQIKFVYREYTDGLARAAFTQEVALDYIPETTYAYKAARFVVHNADAVHVQYTLLLPL